MKMRGFKSGDRMGRSGTGLLISPKSSMLKFNPGGASRRRSLLRGTNPKLRLGDTISTRNNIKVIVRVRPKNAREESSTSVLQCIPENLIVFDPINNDDDGFYFHGVKQPEIPQGRKCKNLQFAFDKVYPPKSTNAEIYQEVMSPAIDSLLEGFNISVFAYGQTGSGKTYTMLGNGNCPGLTYLTIVNLYEKLEALKESHSVKLTVAYLEVYNETVKDLLNPSVGDLNIREDNIGVTIPNLTFFSPSNATELLNLLMKGNKLRSQHPTDLNSESSRSHAVFQVILNTRARFTDLSSKVVQSKLVMIDLAGSERGKATGFAGDRFREGASINCSLLALGNCINALASGKKHIPYRNSKLTRILKDTLGGKSKTFMIANVSPSSISYDETYQTLRYADRAKKIKCVAKKNTLSVNVCVNQYNKALKEMTEQIAALKSEIAVYKNSCTCNKEKIDKECQFSAPSINFSIRAEASKALPETFLEAQSSGEQKCHYDTNSNMEKEAGSGNFIDSDCYLKLKRSQQEFLEFRKQAKCRKLLLKSKGQKLHLVKEIYDSSSEMASKKCMQKLEKQIVGLEQKYSKILKKKVSAQEKLQYYTEKVIKSGDFPKIAKELQNAETEEDLQYYQYSTSILKQSLRDNQQLLVKAVKCLISSHVVLQHYDWATEAQNKIYEDVMSEIYGTKVRWADDLDFDLEHRKHFDSSLTSLDPRNTHSKNAFTGHKVASSTSYSSPVMSCDNFKRSPYPSKSDFLEPLSENEKYNSAAPSYMPGTPNLSIQSTPQARSSPFKLSSKENILSDCTEDIVSGNSSFGRSENLRSRLDLLSNQALGENTFCLNPHGCLINRTEDDLCATVGKENSMDVHDMSESEPDHERKFISVKSPSFRRHFPKVESYEYVT